MDISKYNVYSSGSVSGEMAANRYPFRSNIELVRGIPGSFLLTSVYISEVNLVTWGGR